jgi:urate oxidase
MLKFIQKWLHNNVLKKYGFGWLYRDFFTFPNTFDRWLYMYTILVYEYNNHKDDKLIIQEAEHHMSWNTFTYYMKTNSHYDK